MKKFFEKHELIKLAGIFIFIAILLSWIVPYGYYSNGKLLGLDKTEFTWNLDMNTRGAVGFFDWGQNTVYSIFGVFQYTSLFLLVFVIAAFYKLLSNLKAYQALVSHVASKFNGKEKILIVISTLVFACFSGVTTETFAALAIIPFVIAIMSKLKIDKTSALLSTFGGTLVGVIGATYSPKIVGQLANTNYTLGLGYAYELIAMIILFAVSYLLVTYFAISRLSKKGTPVEDIFAVKEETSKKAKEVKVNVTPLVVILTLFFVIVILGFIPWEESFGITLFKDVYTKIVEFDGIGNFKLFSMILGSSFVPFGSLSVLDLCVYLFLFMLIIKFVYHIPFDKVLDSFADGFKAISKTAVIMLLVLSVLVFSAITSTLPVIMDAILGIGNNIVTLFLSGILGNLFTVDFQYTNIFFGTAFSAFKDSNVVGLALQATHGLVSFASPTSLTLMVGLSMLNVRFSEYFKNVWKLLVALTLVVIVVLAILMFV